MMLQVSSNMSKVKGQTELKCHRLDASQETWRKTEVSKAKKTVLGADGS